MLAGGYALTAHQLLERRSRDVDFATASSLPLTEIVTRLLQAYEQAGFTAELIEATPRMARMVVSTDAIKCDVDLLKEAIGPPIWMALGPVLALEDAVGLKVRALHDRAAHRDFIDLQAANARFSLRELEALGARHTVAFSLDGLADRLGGIEELEPRIFAFYGLADDEIAELRRWAGRWSSDIRARLAAGETGPTGVSDSGWDSYLEDE